MDRIFLYFLRRFPFTVMLTLIFNFFFFENQEMQRYSTSFVQALHICRILCITDAHTERPKTKRPKDKTSQGTKRSKDKMSHRQNDPRDKTSHGTNVTCVACYLIQDKGMVSPLPNICGPFSNTCGQNLFWKLGN